MGRAGPGLFDSDLIWDLASDLNPLIGIDLANAGCLDLNTEEDEIKIYSVSDSAAHLDDGNFNRVFGMLKSAKQDYMLCLFVIFSMRVGANISSKHLKYIEKIYETVEAWEYLPECREQIRVGIQEYESGKPYTFKDFDFGDDYNYMSDPEEARAAMRVGPKNYHVPAKPMKHCKECEKSKELESKKVVGRPDESQAKQATATVSTD